MRIESDDEFRIRVLYVAGDTQEMLRLTRNASGTQLDAIAAEYNLRRLTERERVAYLCVR